MLVGVISINLNDGLANTRIAPEKEIPPPVDLNLFITRNVTSGCASSGFNENNASRRAHETANASVKMTGVTVSWEL